MKRAIIDVVHIVALWSMCLAILAGTLTSLLESQAASLGVMSFLTNVALFVWAGCGTVLWVRAWRWLLKTWSSRGTVSNIIWILGMVFGSIILPVIAYKHFAIAKAGAA